MHSNEEPVCWGGGLDSVGQEEDENSLGNTTLRAVVVV